MFDDNNMTFQVEANKAFEDNLILHMVVRVKDNQNDEINIYYGEDPDQVVK